MQLRKVFHLLVRLNAKSGFEYKHASILFTRDNIVVENSNDTKSANNSERTDDTENGVLVEFIEPENPVFQQRATSVLFASAQEKLSVSSHARLIHLHVHISVSPAQHWMNSNEIYTLIEAISRYGALAAAAACRAIFPPVTKSKDLCGGGQESRLEERGHLS